MLSLNSTHRIQHWTGQCSIGRRWFRNRKVKETSFFFKVFPPYNWVECTNVWWLCRREVNVGSSSIRLFRKATFLSVLLIRASNLRILHSCSPGTRMNVQDATTSFPRTPPLRQSSVVTEREHCLQLKRTQLKRSKVYIYPYLSTLFIFSSLQFFLWRKKNTFILASFIDILLLYIYNKLFHASDQMYI